MHLPTFFYSIPNYYNRKKHLKNEQYNGIENLLETIFMVPLSIIEIFIYLTIPLEMLLEASIIKQLGKNLDLKTR